MITKPELVSVRSDMPGPIRLKDGQTFYGTLTADDEADTVLLLLADGNPITIHVGDLDAE